MYLYLIYRAETARNGIVVYAVSTVNHFNFNHIAHESF
jgi:hypothetical protein